MTNEISTRTSVKVPAGAIGGIVGSIIGLGVIYGVYAAKTEAQEQYNSRMERRVDKLEDSSGRVLEILGRIDERTSNLSKQLEGTTQKAR